MEQLEQAAVMALKAGRGKVLPKQKYGVNFTGIRNNTGVHAHSGIAGILNEFPDTLPEALTSSRSHAVGG